MASPTGTTDSCADFAALLSDVARRLLGTLGALHSSSTRPVGGPCRGPRPREQRSLTVGEDDDTEGRWRGSRRGADLAVDLAVAVEVSTTARLEGVPCI